MVGADRVQIDFLRRAGFHHHVSVFGGQNGREVHAQVSQERRLRAVQHEAHGVVVHFFDLGDQLRHVHAFKVFVTAAGHFVIGVVRIQLAFKGEHHVVGVEIARRFEVFAALPLHAFAQVEGVGFAVFADVPLLSQAGCSSVVPVLNSTSRL